jgi:hypothetical protein
LFISENRGAIRVSIPKSEASSMQIAASVSEAADSRCSHPAMKSYVVFIPPAPAPLVAPRNLAPAGEEGFFLCLLSLSC